MSVGLQRCAVSGGSCRKSQSDPAHSTAIGPGDDFQIVPAGIAPVDPTPAVIAVDLALPPPGRIRPVVEIAQLYAPEYLIELRLAHQEGIVLDDDLIVARLNEIEAHAV